MTTKKAEREAQIAANKRTAYTKKVQGLVGFLFGRIDRDALNAAFDAGVSAEDHAVSIANKSPVGAAIHPLKTDAMARARQLAEKKVEAVRADLEKHGWDLNAAAPRAHWRDMYRDGAKEQNAKNALYSRLPKQVGGYRREGEPDIREMSDDNIARFIASNEEDAALQYDMFICKLVAKVGEVTEAQIEGNHVWGESYLTVVTEAGVRQVWKTLQIVNVSKLGNYFNQWPTRLMK